MSASRRLWDDWRMGETVNIYCDESGYLERDGQRVMVLGAVWCPAAKAREIAVRLREIKTQHGLSQHFETKWTKVSPAQQEFYLSWVDYFFDDDDLHFRGLVVPDKALLRHNDFEQSHDDWYYKMYFDMLKTIFLPTNHYRVYIDIKDTLGFLKLRELHNVMCNAQYDFNRQIVERVQLVRSHEVEQVQLADLLIGAVALANKGNAISPAKNAVLDRVRRRSGYDLTRTTLYAESKVNLLRWRAAEAACNE